MRLGYCMNRIPSRGRSCPWNTVFPRLYCTPKVTGWEHHPVVTSDMKHEIEGLWKQHVDNFCFSENSVKPKAYILSMFPYPSGKLHMGHVRVYTISDTLARFYRMQGCNVLHPMGWDAFGLPAENAAIQSGEDPAIWTEKNIVDMRSQLKQLGCSFDWDREFATCHPSYYKWTQYIFLQMYKAGLIYHKPSLVNWDPVDKTVLADEQIDENGNSWRSGAKAEKILLTQWFVRSTKFSSSLLKELSRFKKGDWADVINLQKSWIGEVNGMVFDWNISGATPGISLPIWTNKPEIMNMAKFIAIKPGSMLDVIQVKKQLQEYHYNKADGDSATFKAACLDFVARNPFSQESLPIYLVDGILDFPDKSDTYMGVPSEVETDLIFAWCVGISTEMQHDESSKSEHINNERIYSKAQQMGGGGYLCSSILKDWLISRQRYWGTPIPIIHCLSCGIVPVPEDQLPVQLPPYPLKKASVDIRASPLANVADWLNTTCPKCGGPGTRETDTMDTFVDSSWYYLRFLDPKNDKVLVDPDKARNLMPVDVYIGGKEHATLHLYYARVVSHFLYQWGITSHSEPFQRLLVQGMVMGQTFIESDTGRFLKRNEVELRGKDAFCVATGKPVAVKWDKMSKSKHNGVDPADVIRSYGVDTTRLLMLADVAPFSQRNWDPEGSKGVFNWQHNMYGLVSHFLHLWEQAKNGELEYEPSSPQFLEAEDSAYQLRNKHLSSINHNYRSTHQFMVANKSMQTLTKKLRLLPKEVVAYGSRFEEALATLITAFAPMAPHFASELWRGFASAPGRLNEKSCRIAWEKPVLEQTWPEVDDQYKLPVHILVNNREVCVVMVPNARLKTLKEDELLQMALKQEVVEKLLEHQKPIVKEITNASEREATVFLEAKGIEITEDVTIPSYTKKARQTLAKLKKKTRNESGVS